MKLGDLRKKLIIESVICAGTIIALSGLAWLASYMAESSAESKNSISGQVAGIDNQSQALNSKLIRLRQDSPEYKGFITGEKQQDLLLNRNEVRIRPIFDAMQLEGNLDDVRASVDPVQELAEAKYKKPRAAGITSAGLMEFKSFTDIESVATLERLEENMPGGIVKITQFSVTRPINGPTSGKAGKIATIKSTPQVDNRLRFQWMGLKDPAPPTARPVPASITPPKGNTP